MPEYVSIITGEKFAGSVPPTFQVVVGGSLKGIDYSEILEGTIEDEDLLDVYMLYQGYIRSSRVIKKHLRFKARSI